MGGPEPRDDWLHSPYFIFFRGGAKLTDEEVLAHFELSSYSRTPLASMSRTHAMITEVGEWTLLADDWLYTLWYQPCKWSAIERLAQDRDLFAWSVGECDHSFDFCLYRNGQLVRKHVVEAPNMSDQVVTVDFGEPLPGEAEIFSSTEDSGVHLRRLTEALGIDARVSRDSMRVYWNQLTPLMFQGAACDVAGRTSDGQKEGGTALSARLGRFLQSWLRKIASR